LTNPSLCMNCQQPTCYGEMAGARSELDVREGVQVEMPGLEDPLSESGNLDTILT
jgi:hypothetical protein